MNKHINPPSFTLLAFLATCGAGILWGTGALVVDILVSQHGFSPQNISFWRFAIGSMVLIAIFARHIRWRKLKPLLGTVFFAGTAMAGYVLLWFLGIEQIGAAIPTLIALCLPPVIVTTIAIIRGQEKASLSLMAILFGAILGTVLIIFKHDESANNLQTHNLIFGVIFSIGSALLYAGFSMVSGKISMALGAGSATACLSVVATLVMVPFALYQPFIWPADIPPQAWFLYLGVVTAALALLAFSWGAARLKPMVLTIATLLEPLTAVVLASLLLNQHLSPLQWIGGSLLLCSIWFLGRKNR